MDCEYRKSNLHFAFFTLNNLLFGVVLPEEAKKKANTWSALQKLVSEFRLSDIDFV